MTILFDATRPVKTRRRRPFAAGLSEPKREPYTGADLAWAAQALNENSEVYVVVRYRDEPAARLEQRAGEAAWYDTMAAQTEARRGTPVSLDAHEEAANRYALPPRTPEQEAEIDRDWAEYDAWQAQMSRWIDGRGPRPE